MLPSCVVCFPNHIANSRAFENKITETIDPPKNLLALQLKRNHDSMTFFKIKQIFLKNDYAVCIRW